MSWLRLAAAAGGSGREDEALRIERQVASAEGVPGPNDPRGWARMLSAARLGRLLADKSAPAGQIESVSRKLKELGVFSGPAALVILTWEDYKAALSLVGLDGDKEAPAGEPTVALPVGEAEPDWATDWDGAAQPAPAPDLDVGQRVNGRPSHHALWCRHQREAQAQAQHCRLCRPPGLARYPRSRPRRCGYR